MADGHRVVVYYQTQYDTTLAPNSPFGHFVSPLPLIGLITHLILAAFHINIKPSPIPLALNDFAPDHPQFNQMWEDIAEMRSKGVKIIGMLGGTAPGTYDGLVPGDTFDTYYPILRDSIRKHRLHGIDLDVEQSVPLENIQFLINRFRSDFGHDFIITLSPVASALTEGYNLSGFDYIELERTMGTQIAWYNAQFYSGFGSIFPDQQYIDIVEFGLDPSRLVALTLTNPDLGQGYVDPDEVVQSVTALAEKYGYRFGGVAGWEYFISLPAAGRPWEWAALMKITMSSLVRLAEEADHSVTNTKRSRVWGKHVVRSKKSN
ncbi:endo-beta-N-acetylglucosaminidase [Collybia nuda]|uniref:Endo-beta-N-acetylglucosaminidase n=1 Tax=Collybia nuda TaxID=64659 RepID=A0A9P5Y0X4_9AGAR|nr:endo-beta-N-acetylglucosaminidase [Collybia nuda]